MRVSVGLSVVGEGLQRMRALPKNPGLQTAPSPSRTDPTRADSPRTEPKPGVWLPAAGTPLPTKLRGRGITITTAQLGRVDWPGRVSQTQGVHLQLETDASGALWPTVLPKQV